jgi:hypothetical protein
VSRGTIVGIATRPRAGRSGVRVPVGASDSSVLHGLMTGCGAHPASCSVGTGGLSPEVKWPGREVN